MINSSFLTRVCLPAANQNVVPHADTHIVEAKPLAPGASTFTMISTMTTRAFRDVPEFRNFTEISTDIPHRLPKRN